MNTLDYVAAAKAEAGGVHGAELAALRWRLRQLDGHEAGRLPGDVLEPLPDLPRVDELPEPPPGQPRDVLGRLVVVKLNGGLGTSMGLSGPTRSWSGARPGRATSTPRWRRPARSVPCSTPGCAHLGVLAVGDVRVAGPRHVRDARYSAGEAEPQAGTRECRGLRRGA
jgi:UTP--glucose-1-phosphate uridylyltransferase